MTWIKEKINESFQLLKFLVKLLLVSSFAILNLCCSENQKPSNFLFCPNQLVTLKSLQDDGYEWMKDDVVIFGKSMGDTLIYYQFDEYDENSNPLYQFIRIKSPVRIDSSTVFSFLQDHNLILLNKDYKIEESYPLYVLHRHSKFIYKLDFNNYDDGKYYFLASFEFPIPVEKCLDNK